MAERSQDPFADAVRTLLAERSMSMRALAEKAGVDVSHLSRLLSGAYPGKPSHELMVRVNKALDLPADYFAEARTDIVIEQIKADPALRDRLYDDLATKRKRGRRSSS